MDTKLKNNKKQIWVWILVTVLAAGIFVSLFPYFEKKANDYLSGQESGFESESFVATLMKSNFVLYLNALEKSGADYEAKDLYVEVKEEPVEEAPDYEYEGEGEAVYSSAGDVKGRYSEQIALELSEIKVNYANAVMQGMDYCVLEQGSGTVLKNTSRKIEELAEGSTESDYPYYIVLQYDENGSLANIRVKGTDAERFLKSAQFAANSEEARLLSNRDKTEHYIMTDNETGKVTEKLTLTQKNPRNATFIYAMTSEQMQEFYRDGAYVILTEDGYLLSGNGTVGEWGDIFNRIGAGNTYLLFLAVLAVLVLVLAKCRPQLLAETRGKTFSAELIFILGIILLAGFYDAVLKCMQCSSQDVYADWINRNFPVRMEAGTAIYVTIEFLINFCVMAALFGAWLWCLLSVKEIVNGIPAFIKKRSFLYGRWSDIKGFFKHMYRKFKDEMQKADLGRDNKRLLQKLVIINFLILFLIVCCWTIGIPLLVIYSFILYGLLKNYIFKVQYQYGKMLEATNSIAEGNLNNTFEENFGLFESYKAELYKIQDGFSKAVEEEVKSQRMKTELITNVSHDLKTPLTAIITYIDLLKEENITEEQRREYLDTLERKSLRLKVLIEDLFEVSKANSGNVKIEPIPVDICNLLRQVYLEHEEKMKQQGLDVRFEMPEEKVILQLDSQKTYRIFENLYVNITKYAMPGTRVFVQAKKREDGNGIHIEMKNMSEREITVNPQDLTERFVRGDASRNTEGSGLGLAIAKSFVELQGGTFRIETDGDLFKAVIEWQ